MDQATLSPAPSPHELKIPKEVEEWLQAMSPGMFQNYKAIESTWNYPATQFSVTLANDPVFRGAVSDMAHKDGSGRQFLTFELILILAIWILRAWRLSKAATWLVKLWVQLWVGALFWAITVFGLPFWVWGSSYKTVLGQLFKAIIRHFF